MKKAPRDRPRKRLPPEEAERPGAPPVPVVVGIGASAGGLEAVQQFLEAMPPETGLAFVHIQHLDPEHKSIMADLLQGSTRMRVVEATDGTRVEAGWVYVSPPDRDIALGDGVLRLTRAGEPRHGRLTIDGFFRSLAAAEGDRAVAVVLSGTGMDGTLGLRAVKNAGGMTIVQEPSSAKYDGMPRSAIAAQLADFVARPEDIPRILLGHVKSPGGAPSEGEALASGAELRPIFDLLRERTGHDFSAYKPSTIRRRIVRRMAALKVARLADYVQKLQGSGGEVDTLFRDLLIGVTTFFRDPEVFRTLEEKAIPPIADGSVGSGNIRVWVPACSTGEEAYSLAILLAERLERERIDRKVTVFATDIDTAAIDVARAATYPATIAADVPAARLDRFFVRQGDAFRIAKRVRETVIFAVQDVLKDPPFSRIDLISCRNLLIYLGPDVQRKLMALFHAVLNPGGFLLLGASETVGEPGELFAPVDRKWKIYAKRSVPTHPILGVTSLHALDEGRGARKAGGPVLDPSLAGALGEMTARVLLDSYAPACVVVDEDDDILYLQGRTARYLELPIGAPRLNLRSMARGDLQRELYTALHKARKEKGEIVRGPVAGEGGAVRLRIKPFRGPRVGQELLLVAFEELPAPAQAAAASGAAEGPRVAALERELASLKDSLQITVEEVETSNEELRSTNEELQSANEELQSTNEELETSKEELQSVNEELMTVNAELQKKLEELSQANNDLANLLDSTQIGTLFLDDDLRLKRFTPAISRLINLIPTDVGRPIGDIVTQIVGDDLDAQVREVRSSLAPHEREVATRAGRWFLRRILPYRTVDNVIDGVVVTFVDTTEIREARRRVEATLTFADALLDAVRHPVILLSREGRVVQVNQAFFTLFARRREDTLGAPLADLGALFRDASLAARLAAVLAGAPPLAGHEVTAALPPRGQRTLRFYANRIAFGTKAFAGEEELTLLAVEDVTQGGGPRPKRRAAG